MPPSRFYYAAGLLTAVCIFTATCQRQELDHQTALWVPLNQQEMLEAREELLQEDLSAELLATSYDPAVDGGPHSHLAALRPWQAQTLNLTTREQRQTGIMYTKSGPSGLVFLFMALTDHAKEHDGKLPASGVDLFSYLLTEEGYRQYLAMDKSSRLDKYAKGVNRITGRFYDTFESADWSPGGVYLERVTDEEVLRGEFSNYRDKETKGLPRVWKLRVYGERPGSVLLEQHMLRGAEVIDSSWPGVLSPLPAETSEMEN